jgi:ABC-type nitrate/sulfonate/bicarbonate transport system ATPase subunit
MLKWDVDFNNTEIIDKYNKVLAEFNIKERGNIFVKELEVTFGNRKKVTAIKDLNFEAKAGELICLLGTTGCGKSTILNAIAGFVSPTNGQIFLDEKPICEAGLERGIVFQRPALFPWRTVKRNVEFGLEMKGISKADRSKIAAAYINIVGLDGFEKNYPSELSGGMEQRVDIARVLANDPLVILMDEPFGSLDAQTRSIMQELLLNISEEFGKTIIFVTHDVDEAIFLADRIVVLTALPGKVKEEIRVSLPRPRSYEVVISNEYINIKKRVLGLIREETLKIVKSIPNISAIDLN